MAEREDQSLVARSRDGDKAAFGELVRTHHKRAYSLAVHLLGNRSEADDVTQDAFLRAFRSIAKFDGRSEFGTWLYRIVVNLCLNVIRARKRTSPLAADDPRLAGVSKADPGNAAETRQRYERLATAIDELSPTLRTTLVLVAVQGLSHKQAAELLDCAEGTVAWRVHEARRRLKQSVETSAAAAAPRPSSPAPRPSSPAPAPTTPSDTGGKDETDEGWE